MTNPINWLKLETRDRSIKYLKVDWLDDFGDKSLVLIDFEPNFNSQLTEKIFLDFDNFVRGFEEEGRQAHRQFQGEYNLAGRMNNAPYYMHHITWQKNDEPNDRVLMFKDSSWFLCQKLYGQYDCEINLTMQFFRTQFEEPDEIMTDVSYNNLFDNTDWLLSNLNGRPVAQITSFIDGSKPTGFYQKIIKFEVWSDDDRWYWSGDDVTIVQKNKFGDYINSWTILPEGAKYGKAYFDARYDDKFVIKNGGDNGVYIKQMKFDNKTIYFNSKHGILKDRVAKFWIDGDKRDCSELPTIDGLIIIDAEIDATSCDYIYGYKTKYG